MSRFIETIRATEGRLGDLRFHQQRVDETLQAFQSTQPLSLVHILQQQSIPDFPIAKIRITYTTTGFESIQIEPYTIRPVKSLALAPIGTNRYEYKYADRTWLQSLVANAGTDDIILFDGTLIKDASYANLAFFDGQEWFTPRQPLLQGTKRRAMVAEGQLIEKDIHLHELHLYQSVKLMNAMLLWSEAPVVTIDQILL